MLLDRAHDVFLARRRDADGWIVKPLDAFRLRRAATGAAGRRGLDEPVDPAPGACRPDLTV